MRPFSFFFLFCSAVLVDAQDLGMKDGELNMGIPTVPTAPNRIDILQRKGSLRFDAKSNTLKYLGDFSLYTDSGLELNSRNAIFDIKSGRIELEGDVSIFNQGILQTGSRATYDSRTRQLITEGLRVSVSPILMEAGKFRTERDNNGQDFFIGNNAGITTHDVENPNFWARADEIKVYPESRVTFKDLKLYAGNTPIFWLPYFSQPLNSELGYHFVPGARSSWGAYLLNRYGVMVSGDEDAWYVENGESWLLAQYLVDIRTRRGLGLGVDFKDTRLRDNPNLTGLSLYFADDLDSQISRSGIVRPQVQDHRYQVALQHRLNLYDGQYGRTFLDSNFSWMSDAFFREDFEPKLYRIDPFPDNSVSLLHRTPFLLGGLSNRLRLNHFYDTETTTPEVFLDFIKSPVFRSPILYEGQISAGKYKEYLADAKISELEMELDGLALGDPRADQIEAILDKKGYNRFHTWHEFSMPIRPFRGAALVPHAGFGYTNYWDNKNGLSGFDRTLLQAGVDFSLKFSKRYDSVVVDRWGVDGLLHSIQPYMNYTILKTDEPDATFRSIERLTPSTELRPIKVGRFSAIDSLSQWSIMRVGVRNNLLTKRNGISHPWLTMNNYIDIFIEDPELDRDYSNVYNEIAWHPMPWIKLDLNAQFPIGNERDGFGEYSTNATFMPSRNTEISLGYRYLVSHPTLEDSSRIDIRAYHRFNEHWGASATQRWELDDGTLESHQYSVYRDLGSWTTSLGFIQRDNRIKNELGLMLSFTLKEFPAVSLPFTVDND